jgi:hypothetical protein
MDLIWSLGLIVVLLLLPFAKDSIKDTEAAFSNGVISAQYFGSN